MFSKTLTLQRGQEEYQLCGYLEDCTGAPGKTAAIPFFDSVSALHFLRELITDSGKQHELRLWLLNHAPSFEMYAIDDDNLLDRTAKMIASGQLVVAGTKEGGGGGETQSEGILRPGGKSILVSHVEATPLQDETARRSENQADNAAADEAADEAAAVSEEPLETTWIELELMDPEGNPVPNERYKITMPDGSIKYGRLDSDAKARIEKLQPGSCQVTFPDRDQEVWEVG